MRWILWALALSAIGWTPDTLVSAQEQPIVSKRILEAIHPGLKMGMKEEDLAALLPVNAVPFTVIDPSRRGLSIEAYDKTGKALDFVGLTNDEANKQMIEANSLITYVCEGGRLNQVAWMIHKSERPFPDSVATIVRHQLETAEMYAIRNGTERVPFLVARERDYLVTTSWHSEIRGVDTRKNKFVYFRITAANPNGVDGLPRVNGREDHEAFREFAKEFGLIGKDDDQ